MIINLYCKNCKGTQPISEMMFGVDAIVVRCARCNKTLLYDNHALENKWV